MNLGAQSTWPEETNDLLKTWYTVDGLSCAQISRRLRADLKLVKSRNAVIGRISRLGFSGQAGRPKASPAARAPRAERQTPQPRRQLRAVVARTPEAPAPTPIKQRCVWPVPVTAKATVRPVMSRSKRSKLRPSVSVDWAGVAYLFGVMPEAWSPPASCRMYFGKAHTTVVARFGTPAGVGFARVIARFDGFVRPGSASALQSITLEKPEAV